MDDDVKNLFQKFGQPATAYQEISREVESEQAKKRWPLLRDVRVHAIPDHASADNEEFSEAQRMTPSLKQEAVPDVHHKPLFNRSSSADIPESGHPSVKKKETASPAMTTFASPGIFQSGSQQKMVLSKQEEPLKNEMNSLFRTPKASVVSTTAVQAESQNNGVALPVHTDKHQPLSAVFKRLAAQPEPAKTTESPVNSFFKKIFKS